MKLSKEMPTEEGIVYGIYRRKHFTLDGHLAGSIGGSDGGILP